MKKYSFLLKPLFFIFNLLFATWLVLKIEKIRPSDFGRYKGIFEPAAKMDVKHNASKIQIKKIMQDYKEGKLSEKQAEKELENILKRK